MMMMMMMMTMNVLSLVMWRVRLYQIVVLNWLHDMMVRASSLYIVSVVCLVTIDGCRRRYLGHVRASSHGW